MPVVLGRERFPALSDAELRHFQQLCVQYPHAVIYQSDDILQQTILKFGDNDFVALGVYIGSGMYGSAYTGTRYQLRDGVSQTSQCVVKTNKKPDLVLGAFANITSTCMHCILIDESKKISEAHNVYGLINTGHDENAQTFILLPYLGDMSLAQLIANENIIMFTQGQEWLKLFSGLMRNLANYGEKTRHIHNDIKPDNIGVSIIAGRYGYEFTQTNFFDLGKSHADHLAVRGTFSKYQPLDSQLGLFSPIFKKTVDVYSLGKSLLELLDAIQKYNMNETDKRAFSECRILFERMTDFFPSQRPTLKTCIETIESISRKYYGSENQSSVHVQFATRIVQTA